MSGFSMSGLGGSAASQYNQLSCGDSGSDLDEMCAATERARVAPGLEFVFPKMITALRRTQTAYRLAVEEDGETDAREALSVARAIVAESESWPSGPHAKSGAEVRAWIRAARAATQRARDLITTLADKRYAERWGAAEGGSPQSSGSTYYTVGPSLPSPVAREPEPPSKPSFFSRIFSSTPAPPSDQVTETTFSESFYASRRDSSPSATTVTASSPRGDSDDDLTFSERFYAEQQARAGARVRDPRSAPASTPVPSRTGPVSDPRSARAPAPREAAPGALPTQARDKALLNYAYRNGVEVGIYGKKRGVSPAAVGGLVLATVGVIGILALALRR